MINVNNYKSTVYLNYSYIVYTIIGYLYDYICLIPRDTRGSCAPTTIVNRCPSRRIPRRRQINMCTRERLIELRDEALADDLDIDDTMLEWSEAEAIAFFDSGGTKRPGDKAVAAAEVDVTDAELSEGLPEGDVDVSLGGIALPARAVPSSPHLVPWVGALNGTPPGLGSQSSLSTLRWLVMQLQLGQDSLILADPSARPRRLVHWLCALLGRECESVAITRDTTESDLKQRREMRGGTVVHEAAPPLRAALHGRVLLLEGVEKAERNVLPLLNNLLENREMAMDDGSFLAAPWAGEGGEVADEAGSDDGILRCSPAFVVIAIGWPQPAYPGERLRMRMCTRSGTRTL